MSCSGQVEEIVETAEVLLICSTCNIIFFKGSLKWFLANEKERPFVDYVLLSRGHAWDEPDHYVTGFITAENVTKNVDPEDSISYVAREKKMEHTHIANQKFWSIWNTHEQPVKCSVCHSERSSIQAACFCCQSEKVTFYFPYEHLDVLMQT